ncbi:DUF1194 domain-containing protein [Amylibacter sp. SFDW26]|uniref:DUF1194 domain-containing protein n=1 Tax=Amylibacter sp. SFDW26 TaxID=2652722 RepID=UPI00126259EA|nr:DUF1194 domain-containing protein [Amylibacter sp. SFDW26]KAB7616038.1 DUF1194 domain-containing protein [Amylibacter sp. SFDW26]
MNAQLFIQMCCAALLGFGPTQAIAQDRCSVELILALDVSGSVDWKEYRLQRVGVASAFRDPEVTELISFLPGGIQVAITQWAGPQDQRVVLNWHSIQNKQSSFAFADKIEDTTRYTSGPMTAIGNALIHANRLLQRNPKPCLKSVIDVSADGHNNQGNEPADVAAILEAKGVTINALVVVGEDLTLLRYFEKNVIRGHGAFVQPTYGYKDYARAIKEKLLRELSPSLSYIDTEQPNHFVTVEYKK